jgi:hypothetical protein
LAELIVFAALLAFLPVPLIIPFVVMALIPMSLLVFAFLFFLFAVLHGGPPISVAIFFGFCILVIAPILYGIAKLLCSLIYRVRDRSTRITLVAAFVLTLFAMSLLPIYKPGLDPPKPSVNIIGLFRSTISGGQ